ncbi:hypothetical protein DV096_12245 [Bradymonadaceae bacterium TMQ3]|nr:hypothetical protein DV096_12245 [Bradymonadaceae bacterium TMQ3]
MYPRYGDALARKNVAFAQPVPTFMELTRPAGVVVAKVNASQAVRKTVRVIFLVQQKGNSIMRGPQACDSGHGATLNSAI